MKKLFLLIFLAVSVFSLSSFSISDSTPGKFPSDWILIQKDGLYGFVNLDGEVVVKPIFDIIYEFDDYQKGWAKVEKDGLLGFINFDGVTVVKPIFDIIMPFGVYKSDWAAVEKNGMLGFIDKDGVLVVKPEYDTLERNETGVK